MTGRVDQTKDHYFCKRCGFKCRSVKLWNEHKKKEKEIFGDDLIK